MVIATKGHKEHKDWSLRSLCSFAARSTTAAIKEPQSGEKCRKVSQNVGFRHPCEGLTTASV